MNGKLTIFLQLFVSFLKISVCNFADLNEYPIYYFKLVTNSIGKFNNKSTVKQRKFRSCVFSAMIQITLGMSTSSSRGRILYFLNDYLYMVLAPCIRMDKGKVIYDYRASRIVGDYT